MLKLVGKWPTVMSSTAVVRFVVQVQNVPFFGSYHTSALIYEQS